MKIEIGIAIAIIWFVFNTISRAAKKNKANLQRGAQNSNNSANASQNFQAQAVQRPSNGPVTSPEVQHWLDNDQPRSAERIDPFSESKSLESGFRGHYDEGALVEEYKRTHDKGKAVAHHRHKLFDESKDRRAAESHRHTSAPKGTARAHATMHSPAPERRKRAERRNQQVHPLAQALKGKQNFKQAFLLSEILRRPDF